MVGGVPHTLLGVAVWDSKSQHDGGIYMPKVMKTVMLHSGSLTYNLES